MVLGSLIDAGAERDAIVAGIRSLGLGELDLAVTPVKKCGFRALHVQVIHPPEHAHRHLHHIEAMIDKADQVAPQAKEMAKKIFRCIGEAEAFVHGTTLQKVHFHEVGAVDSIADIVGAAIALTELNVERVEASAVPTGSGFIEIAHGRVSVPAPATAELLKGIPIAPSEIQFELTTPTGAAILKATASRFGAVPAMRIHTIGYGAGTRDLPGQANVLRVLIGDTGEIASPYRVDVDQVLVLETNIDNTTAEELAACVQRLWDSGALDVYQIPCLMKKGRSGVQVTVLCAASRAAELEGILFMHGGTIGIRRTFADRRKLIRRELTVETTLGPIRGKCVWLPNGSWRFAAELEDVNAVAIANQWTISRVRELAQQAFQTLQPLPAP
jgi:uncharacterized protein (TIGR00299 family) protein